MSAITKAIVDLLKTDHQLVAMLPVYKGEPTIYSTDPAPGETPSPYIVTAGEVVHLAWDTKTSRGRDVVRDVRVYAPAEGSAVIVEEISDRVRVLLHRMPLNVNGFRWIISEVTGPVVADETDYYGRILSLNLKIEEV